MDVTDTSLYTYTYRRIQISRYVDLDGDIQYTTTRITTYRKDRHTVAYRSPILDDGITLGREEPKHQYTQLMLYGWLLSITVNTR